MKMADVGLVGGRILCTAPQSYGAPTLSAKAAWLSSKAIVASSWPDKPDKVIETARILFQAGTSRLEAEG